MASFAEISGAPEHNSRSNKDAAMHIGKYYRYRRPLVVVGGVGTILATVLGVMLSSPNAKETADGTDGSPQIVAAARGVVEVEGGMVRISPQRDGVIVAVKAREGMRVKAGDVLAQLDDEREQLAERIAKAEVSQAESQFRLLQLKEKNLSKHLERLRRAAAGQAVSDQALDEAREAHDSSLVELDSASSTLEMVRARYSLAQYESQLRLVRAPADAVIIHQNIRVGEAVSVQAMTELFTLMPALPKVVHAEIPEEFLSSVRQDMIVDVIPENQSSQPFKGRVARLSSVVTKAEQTSAERSDVRTVSAIITIDGDLPLLVGQRVVIKAVQ